MLDITVLHCTFLKHQKLELVTSVQSTAHCSVASYCTVQYSTVHRPCHISCFIPFSAKRSSYQLPDQTMTSPALFELFEHHSTIRALRASLALFELFEHGVCGTAPAHSAHSWWAHGALSVLRHACGLHRPMETPRVWRRWCCLFVTVLQWWH